MKCRDLVWYMRAKYRYTSRSWAIVYLETRDASEDQDLLAASKGVAVVPLATSVSVENGYYAEK